MNHETIAPDLVGAFSATSTPTLEPVNPEPQPGRRPALENLYISNYSSIRDIAASDPSLFIGDIETLLNSVAARLNDYTGPADDSAAFLEWAESILKPAVDALVAFYKMKAEHSAVVYAGIWRILGGCDGLGVSPEAAEEIAQTVWVRVLLDLDAWLAPGYSKKPGKPPAKLSSRLYEFAKFQAMAWKTERVRHKKRFRRPKHERKHENSQK